MQRLTAKRRRAVDGVIGDIREVLALVRADFERVRDAASNHDHEQRAGLLAYLQFNEEMIESTLDALAEFPPSRGVAPAARDALVTAASTLRCLRDFAYEQTLKNFVAPPPQLDRVLAAAERTERLLAAGDEPSL